jgi:hypothetical protein
LQHVYLSGQGRAPGDETAVLRRVREEDSFGVVESQLSPEVRVLLNGYTANARIQDLPTNNSRAFDSYNLIVDEISVATGSGGSNTIGNGNSPVIDASFPADIRVYPGRQTSISVRLDDAMITNDGVHVTFDSNLFNLANLDPVTGKMQGLFSDFVYFDISGLSSSAQPDLPDGSGKATAIFVSGDNFGMGVKSNAINDPNPKALFVLTPTGFVEGTHIGERTLGGNYLPGTYTLVQPDPRPPFDPDARITAMMGIYKSFNQTIAGTGAGTNGFELIAFPNQEDDGLDDAIAVNIVNGQVTAMYFGFMNLNAGTISLFPIDQLDTPEDTSNEVTGTITSMLNGSGGSTTDVSLARSGRFTLNATNLPATFNAAGRFIVYRR